MHAMKKRSLPFLRLGVALFLIAMSLQQVLAARSRNNNVLGNGTVFTMVANFAENIFKLLGKEAFFSVVVIVLLTLLYRYLLMLAVSFIPIFNSLGSGSGSDSKEKVVKNLTLVLAILFSLGTVGWMGFEDYEFSLTNVYNNIENLLSTFSSIAIWAIAGVFGALAYFATYSYAKNRDRKGEITLRERLGVLFVTIGLTLFVGNGIIDNPSYTIGLFIFIIGAVLIFLSYTSDHSAEALLRRGVKKAAGLKTPVSSGTTVDHYAELFAARKNLIDMENKLDTVWNNCQNNLHILEGAVQAAKTAETAAAAAGGTPVPAGPAIATAKSNAISAIGISPFKDAIDDFCNVATTVKGILDSIKNAGDYKEMVGHQKRRYREYHGTYMSYLKKSYRMMDEYKQNISYNHYKMAALH